MKMPKQYIKGPVGGGERGFLLTASMHLQISSPEASCGLVCPKTHHMKDSESELPS